MARIVTSDFPLYFAVVTRARQDKAVIGPQGGVVSSKVVSQVQAVFPPDAVIRNTNVALQVFKFIEVLYLRYR
jgi:ankyrin